MEKTMMDSLDHSFGYLLCHGVLFARDPKLENNFCIKEEMTVWNIESKSFIQEYMRQ